MNELRESWCGALAPDECDAWIRRAESVGFEDAPITTWRGFERRPEVRNNTRVRLDDTDAAAALWDRLSARLRGFDEELGWTPVGLNERLRLYRYEAGQRFRWHRDGAFARSDVELSRWTLLLYLNDDFDGGETEFEDASVRPARGAALAFSHGLLHQGASVRRGVKYVLRTDVMFRRRSP